MATKSLANIAMESNMNNFASTSTPRRRISMSIQKSTSPLVENDDEAERLALRRDSLITSFSKSNEKRQSLGLGSLAQMPEPKMTELISQCIKLSTENKINAKNAFSLEMIDFMTFMVIKRNSELTNLQMASTSLDVCTKIYGYRVDGIYMEILKMVGALDKQKEDNLSDTEQVQPDCTGDEQEVERQTKKKKKKLKQKIITTEDAISGSVETMLPSQTFIGKGDLCSSDMLYQVSLPLTADSGFYYNTYNDAILDKLNNSKNNNENLQTYAISKIDNFSESDLCPSMFDFEFLKWSFEDENEIIEPIQSNNQNRFQFDLDASLPSGDEDFELANDVCMEDVSNTNMCIRNPQRTENIIDFRKVVSEQIMEDQKMPEYSFLQKNINSIHWAGPSYWKNKALNNFLSNSKVVETCQQKAVKKNKELEIIYTNENTSELEQKFLPSKVAKLKVETARTNWKEEKITLPEDIHFDFMQLTKLYLYPLNISNSKSRDLSDIMHLSEDIEDYDYNNENDMSNFCPDIDANGDIQERNDSDELRDREENIIENQIAFTNDNLVTAPTLTNKIFMNYAVRPKKIDMCQLKKTIWNSLIKLSNPNNTDNKEKIERSDKPEVSVPFRDIYKALPNEISKSNVESLSVPISIVSLLHLASEKSLTLSSLPDGSDIIIKPL